jgi:predicted permease
VSLTPHPPRLARAFAHACLRGDAREVIVGDLDQEFAEAIASGTPLRAARRLYWRQTIASIAAVRSKPSMEDDVIPASSPYRPLRGLSLDLRSVLRSLRRSPGYAAVAMLSLAVGIGANTAMFSVVHQLLLAPLAADRPDELRLVYWTAATNARFSFGQLNATGYVDPAGVSYRSNYSYPEFLAIRAAVGDKAAVAGFNRNSRLTISTPSGASVTGVGILASGNFFATLRPPIALGRGLADADDMPGAGAVAVVGHAFWMRALGGDPAIVGKWIHVSGVPVQIVGVTDKRFRGLSPGGFAADTDVTFPLALQPGIVPQWTEPGTSLFTDRNQKWIRVIARIDSTAGAKEENEAAVAGAMTAAARSAMAGAGMTADDAATVTPKLFPAPRGTDSLRTATQLPLRVLTAVLAIVLVLACVNVAGLMLARGVARQREIAVRRALGASRGRVMRELLVESGLLSIAGAVCGLILAVWTAPITAAIVSAGLGAAAISVQPDWRVLGAATCFACVAALLTGLLPAIRFSGRNSTLLDRSGAAGAPRLRVGRVLLALQIAVSLPLVTGAGLFLRTLHNFSRVDLGFDPRGLVLFGIDPTLNGQKPERVQTVFPRVLAELEAVPGVESATLIENALISGFESDSTATIADNKVNVYMQSVGPSYLETIRVPLVSGRTVGGEDRGRGGPASVVINQMMATKYFGGDSPIGQHFKIGRRDVEVVGVAKDTRYDTMRNEAPPTVLWSYLQRPVGAMYVMVRSSLPAAALRPAIEDAIRRVDATLPISGFKTQMDQIDETIAKERVFARLLTVFGTFALILACIGLHGVTSYSVARRTSEIGVRLALGAQRSQVMWLILRQVVVLGLVGLAIGLPIAWFAGPTVRAFLFGVEPTDTMTIAVSALVLFGVAVIAGVLPAHRASRLQALTAMKVE